RLLESFQACLHGSFETVARDRAVFFRLTVFSYFRSLLFEYRNRTLFLHLRLVQLEKRCRARFRRSRRSRYRLLARRNEEVSLKTVKFVPNSFVFHQGTIIFSLPA